MESSFNKKFQDYFESSRLDGIDQQSISSILDSKNLCEFDGILSIDSVSCIGIERNEDKSIHTWDIKYTNKQTMDNPVSFSIQFDPNLETLSWNAGRNISEHFISQLFCESIVKSYHGNISLNTEHETYDVDSFLTDEYKTFDDYLDYILLSGSKYIDDSIKYAKQIKRSVLSKLGDELSEKLYTTTQGSHISLITK